MAEIGREEREREKEQGEGEEEEEAITSPDVHFEPVMKLEEIQQQKTMEEDEIIIFKM